MIKSPSTIITHKHTMDMHRMMLKNVLLVDAIRVKTTLAYYTTDVTAEPRVRQ